MVIRCGVARASRDTLASGFEDFAQWSPILDACQSAASSSRWKFIQARLPTSIYTAEAGPRRVDGREEFEFTFDPATCIGRGSTRRVRARFPERIYHVHIRDVVLHLNGRNGLLGSYLPPGDTRRGWITLARPRRHRLGGGDLRPNEVGYDGPLSVDWNDPG